MSAQFKAGDMVRIVAPPTGAHPSEVPIVGRVGTIEAETMNKMNPSAMALVAAAAAARLGANAIAQAEASKGPKVDPIEARRAPVPAGYKRVYHGHIPHQGAKETARRQRQQHKAAFHKARSDLNVLLNGFAGRENTPEVREEITRAVVAYVDAQTEFREIAQMMANWILEKLGVAGETDCEVKRG